MRRDAPLPKDVDLLLSWRFRQSEELEDNLRDGMVMCCFDLGYFDDTKFERFSISINGVHGMSMHVPLPSAAPPRPHPPIRPWKTEGQFIQIISPGWLHDTRMRAAASDLPTGWMNWAVDAAIEVFGKPAKIRPHPRGLAPGEKPPPPLEDTFEETYVSVSYGSNTAIQTVFAGVPTVVQNKRCPAYCMSSQTMSIVQPDRQQWAHELSYREYDMRDDAELAKATRYIQRGYEIAKMLGPLEEPLENYGIRK